MMASPSGRYSQEFRNQSCEEVVSTSKSIQSVAASYWVSDEKLRSWLKKDRDDTQTHLPPRGLGGRLGAGPTEGTGAVEAVASRGAAFLKRPLCSSRGSRGSGGL